MNFCNKILPTNSLFRLLAGIVILTIIQPAMAELEFPHPKTNSIVFDSPETQQTATQSTEPVFVHPPRNSRQKPIAAATPTMPQNMGYGYPYYPPPAHYNYGRNSSGTFNASPYPSNQDVNTYNVQRSHNFSQDRYRRHRNRDRDFPADWYYYGNGFGVTYPATQYSPYYYPDYYPMPYYPPARARTGSGINQSPYPSNRDMNTYHLNRAHRFSSDAYKARR